jgi:hypothetical protein
MKDIVFGIITLLIVCVLAGTAVSACYITTFLPLKNGYCQTYIQPTSWSGSGFWSWQPCHKVNP